jgi:hypothetical protein
MISDGIEGTIGPFMNLQEVVANDFALMFLCGNVSTGIFLGDLIFTKGQPIDLSASVEARRAFINRLFEKIGVKPLFPPSPFASPILELENYVLPIGNKDSSNSSFNHTGSINKGDIVDFHCGHPALAAATVLSTIVKALSINPWVIPVAIVAILLIKHIIQARAPNLNSIVPRPSSLVLPVASFVLFIAALVVASLTPAKANGLSVAGFKGLGGLAMMAVVGGMISSRDPTKPFMIYGDLVNCQSDKGVLLVGHQQTGKTTLSEKLTAIENGSRWESFAENFVIGYFEGNQLMACKGCQGSMRNPVVEAKVVPVALVVYLYEPEAGLTSKEERAVAAAEIAVVQKFDSTGEIRRRFASQEIISI